MSSRETHATRSSVRRRLAALPLNLQGALWMIAAVMGFTLISVLVRMLGDSGVPAVLTGFMRGAIGLVLIVPLLMRFGGLRQLRTRHAHIHALRVGIGASGMLLGYYAITKLPLAEVTAISFTAPLFTVVLAATILRERVGWRRWGATVVGFLGVLVILRPGANLTALPLLPVMGMLAMAFAIGCSVTLLKFFPEAESQLSMLTWFMAGSVAIAAPWAVPELRPFTPEQWLMLVGVGVSAIVFQWMVIKAFRTAEASFLAPFDYSKLLLAIALGWILFDEVPGVWTYAGAAMIVAATLYIAHREARLARLRRR
ncbi:MAG: DMT family transporter [Alphaproteobacteria bacterium]|nr:DMT family transporter [Alphaproteobacteria bacterium]MDX5369326.1 DMT family transporter [Alphaproteobacteria bacterium]MDX5464011.1 DMT family transporter [Alphaproteobacteria bacterium]